MSNFIFEDPNFKSWKSKVVANGLVLKKVECVGEVIRDKGQVYAALIDCQIVTPEGSYLRCVVLRGDTVVVIPLLTCRSNGGEYTLLVDQLRIAHGKNIEEFPAGMVDRNKKDPVLTAVEEVREELGIDLDSSELIPLNETPFNTIPSLTDEVTNFFYFEREVSAEDLLRINDRQTGVAEDNEFMCVKVHPLTDLASFCKTLSVFVAGKLLEQHLGRSFLKPVDP